MTRKAKRIIIAVAIVIALSMICGYFYFTRDTEPKVDPPDPNGIPTEGVELHEVLYFGGRRGNITLSALPENLPDTAYGILKAYDQNETELFTLPVEIRNGVGQYDVRDKADADHYTLYASLDSDGKQKLTEPITFKAAASSTPGVFITELSNRSTVQFKANTGKETQGQDVRTPLFQFIELHNYSDTDVDLNPLTFVYTSAERQNKFDWIREQGADGVLHAGHTFVIGVYNQFTAEEGFGWQTESDKAEFWKAFNDFYGVSVPKEDRMMIACTESGTKKAINGWQELPLDESSAALQAADGSTVTKVELPVVSPGSSFSYQFVPGGKDAGTEQFLFCTGAFPYALLDEQAPDYVPPVIDKTETPLTVMSYNILADTHTTHTPEVRRPELLTVLEKYQPDTIGLQEVNENWTEWLTQNIPLNYSVVEGLSSKGNDFLTCEGTWDLLNPIYYRNDKFTLLDSGAAFMTPDGNKDTKQWDSNNLKRTMTWVVLEEKATGKRTAHINTHLVLSGYEARIEQVKLMYGKGEELKKKYSCGIITTGDHNMAEGSTSYQTYQHSGVVTDAKYLTVEHNSIATCPDYYKHSDTFGTAIDYCFVSPDDYTVGRYNVVRSLLSDHYGVLVELYQK